MPQEIATYGSDRRLVLSNGEAIRAPIYLENWNSIRIGLRLAVHTTAALSGTPRLAFGMCAGALGYGAITGTPHVIGFRTVGANWTYTGGASNYVFTGGSTTPAAFKRVGNTFTSGGSFGDSPYLAANADNLKCTGLFLDIVKGSPNYTFQIGLAGSTAVANDLSDANFLQMMEAASLSSLTAIVANYTASSSSPTLAVDEAADGDLDHIFVFWDRTSPAISIGAIAHRRLS